MTRICKAIFLFLLVTETLFAQDNASVASGLENFQKKKYKEALADFNQALKSNPANVQALCGSAQVHNALGNSQEALNLAETALKNSPLNDYANYTKGEILLSKKEYNAAIPLFNKALDITPSYFDAYISKSKAYNLMGDIKEAYKILDNAIATFPSSAELFLARGLLNNSREKYSKALDDFNKALKINEHLNSFSVYYNRGIAFSNLQEYDSALDDFNKAAEIEPNNANAFYSRGLANYQLGNYDTAVKDFVRSDQLNPNNPVTYYNLGMAYYKLDDMDDACVYFHKSCGMKNNNACKMIIMVCSGK